MAYFLRDRGTAARPHPLEPQPDERIYGRHYRGPRPWVIGAIAAVILGALTYLAFVKDIPFVGEDYELHATFENVATLRRDAPVRIAGVDVGEVTGIESRGTAAEVTFTVEDEGRPIHEDATIEIRPRLFLEGNFFLDLRPGSPSAPELDGGAEIPMTQTSTAVQLDEILAALDSDSRANLQDLLEGYGEALTHEPTPAEDADQDPDVRGETAAESLNDAFRYGVRSTRDTAIVNEAFLGTQPHDLSRLIAAQQDVFAELVTVESDLQDLITNFNTTTGALAAESENLSETIRLLAPTLENGEPALRHLSDALPPLRALAREAVPGVRELPGTIDAGLPWLRQTKRLLTDRELGGLARDLQGAAPSLAKTTETALRLFPELTRASRCVSRVLVPTGDIVIDDYGTPSLSTGQPNFNEFFYGAVNLAGESQNFDGNGAYVRFQSGGGNQLVRAKNPASGLGPVYGMAAAAPQGTRPTYTTNVPPFRQDVPCFQNPIPNVTGTGGGGLPGDVGPPMPRAVGP
jgi:phospholipid/cholesterol/gamma-HCH transport system substrate-binding protein